ncbi:hypothetical protein CC86DRAFT_389487 [Ophiobolus disseminans]|uniref:Uncharacterized protein n=1 Tax=Ophiobolus disseminans TaxID=1469910 RepID=A0A6A7AK79_9PLEO|nr:hypothetical protein CC86DRAFT_389487 [Ophiobolus disseminans]
MGFGGSGGNEFFNSWALWQKMTFVLACGIVGTIFLGLLKLWYDRNRLAKYSKVDKGKEAQTPEMLEAQPVTAVSQETKDEIPFGIRAIQSGLEVDGVWISRTNTPVGSSRNSIMSGKFPQSQNASQLELPQAVYGSSRNSSRAPSSAFDRAVSAERIPNGSRSSSPGRGQSAAAPVRCGNCNHNIPHNPSALKALESPRSGPPSGPPSPPNGTRYQSGYTSKQSSSRNSDESDYMAIQQDVRSYENAYIRPASNAPVDPRTDLDALQTHRMSHVAETGQLTPRVRKPGSSGEWASVADNQMSSINGVSYFVPQKTPSPPLPATEEEPLATYASHHTQDSYTSNQSKQGVPLMESYAPKAAFYPDTYEPRGPQHQYSYDEVPYEVNTDQNQRDSQVARKVNSGFEILKPGTFAPPTPEELELAEHRQSKKLQKKRRSSETRRSAFVESV